MNSLIFIFSLILSFFIQQFFSFEYIFFQNSPFPFENKTRQISLSSVNNTSNDSNLITSGKISKCIFDALGDGNCDEGNNIEECNFDNGDCCAGSCVANCAAKNCRYQCGSLNPYNCKQDSNCTSCVNGDCVSITQCFQSNEAVMNAIDACNTNNLTQGNIFTIDPYCGKDPIKNITHFANNPVS